jgi:hypothetical protein
MKASSVLLFNIHTHHGTIIISKYHQEFDSNQTTHQHRQKKREEISLCLSMIDDFFFSLLAFLSYFSNRTDKIKSTIVIVVYHYHTATQNSI